MPTGYEKVKIFLSGGVTREDVIAYRDCVDAFGVGGAIANAPVIDFAMDIVEIEGEPKAKRGKRSGVKQVYAKKDGEHIVLPASRKGPNGSNAPDRDVYQQRQGSAGLVDAGCTETGG